MDGDVVRRKHSQVHPTVRIIHSLIHSFIHSDCDEGSRTVLTNRGITYMTESRRRITGIMTIQAYIECKQAKLLLQTCIQSKAEILLLQKSIRSLMIRRLTKEDVAKCDKDTTIEPRAGKIFSSRNKDAQPSLSSITVWKKSSPFIPKLPAFSNQSMRRNWSSHCKIALSKKSQRKSTERSCMDITIVKMEVHLPLSKISILCVKII